MVGILIVMNHLKIYAALDLNLNNRFNSND